MPSPIARQVRWKPVCSYLPIVCGLPRTDGGSAPALRFSRPAQRLLTLRPACSPSRLCDLLHRRLQQLRCLRRCFDCYRVERTSSRAGLTPACGPPPFHGAPGFPVFTGRETPASSSTLYDDNYLYVAKVWVLDRRMSYGSARCNRATGKQIDLSPYF